MEVEWRVAMRLGRRRKLEPGSEEALAEKAKASVRANVEHPFLRLKRLFGFGNLLSGGGSTEGVVGAGTGPYGPLARAMPPVAPSGAKLRDEFWPATPGLRFSQPSPFGKRNSGQTKPCSEYP